MVSIYTIILIKKGVKFEGSDWYKNPKGVKFEGSDWYINPIALGMVQSNCKTVTRALYPDGKSTGYV